MIYLTGYTEDKIPLFGGAWKMKEQEGFPLEMSYVTAKTNGWKIDWIDAMAEASLTNNLPSLMKDIALFLSSEDIVNLQIRFMALIYKGYSYEEILKIKKKYV